MASSFFECSGSVVDLGSGTLQCSSGFLVVSEPTFNLITEDQGAALMTSLIILVVVVVVFKKLSHLF